MLPWHGRHLQAIDRCSDAVYTRRGQRPGFFRKILRAKDRGKDRSMRSNLVVILLPYPAPPARAPCCGTDHEKLVCFEHDAVELCNGTYKAHDRASEKGRRFVRDKRV